jgi:AcrR family transcriptional regulator
MTEVMRARNPRGHGSRLREEILAAATDLLEETGSEQAVTLRAVARRVGISAPSIYAHFPDREAIVGAIIDDAFSDFNGAIYAATEGVGPADPLKRLRAGCQAYLRFAADRPERYRLLFERGTGHPAGVPVPSVRTESFGWLVAALQDCIDGGISASDDAARDATVIWAALHGYATLHSLIPGFPWPGSEVMLDRIVSGPGLIRSQ